MPVYDNNSIDYRDPVAFAVFERFSLMIIKKELYLLNYLEIRLL